MSTGLTVIPNNYGTKKATTKIPTAKKKLKLHAFERILNNLILSYSKNGMIIIWVKIVTPTVK